MYVRDPMPSSCTGVSAVHDPGARDHLARLGQEPHPHFPEDSERWTIEEKKAIGIAKAHASEIPHDLIRYSVTPLGEGYSVHLMWVLRNEDGCMYVPPAGGGHFGVTISGDWNTVQVQPGA